MDARKVKLLIISSIFILVVVVFGVSYAYFLTIPNTENKTNTVVKTSTGPTFNSLSGDDLILNIDSGYMLQSASLEGNVLAADSSTCDGCQNGKIGVILIPNQDSKTKYRAEFDITFKWTENGYYAHTIGATGNEFTITVTDDKNNIITPEKDLDDFNKDENDQNSFVIAHTFVDAYLADTMKTYTINAKFYNVNVDQSALSNKTHKSVISINNVVIKKVD